MNNRNRPTAKNLNRGSWQRWVPSGAALIGLGLRTAFGCDLCAIYRAADAKGDFGSGPTATLAMQHVAYRNAQFNGESFERPNEDFLDRWMIHLVAGWNFTENFGVSLNLPQVVQRYQRRELQNGILPRTLRGTETGMGDASLAGRWRIFEHSGNEWNYSLNLMAGVKLPTGNTDWIEDLERQVLTYESLVGPGHSHDAFGQVVSGVHPVDLSLGSGSFDGIFGAASNARWRRAFFNAQLQYYLRSEGAGSYQNANDFMLSGGPGIFIWVSNRSTLSAQCQVAYETSGSDELLDRASTHMGMTAWYMGPVLVWTWKSQFSLLAGADLPVRIANRGFQNVANYRVNLSATYRF